MRQGRRLRRAGRHPAVLTLRTALLVARLRAAIALRWPRPSRGPLAHPLVVTALTLADAAPFAALHGGPHAPPAGPDAITLGARDGDVLVGACTLRREGRDGWILALTVAPSSRGRGVAGALVDAAVHVARTWGLAAVAARVSLANTPSRRVFSRAGFVEAMDPRDPKWRVWSRALRGVTHRASRSRARSVR